jgi:hypothetical protein
VFKVSGGELVVLLVLSIVWAFLGYRLSENDRQRLGRTPWGLPSGVWALFWFLSLVVGLVLYLIAHASGVRRSQQQPPGFAAPGAPPPPSPARGQGPKRAPTVSEQFPAYPSPANVSIGDDAPGHPGHGGVPAPPAPPAPGIPVSPPAWQPDPSGRFHYRWWDGIQWTSQVATDGHHMVDTSPDQRIGPY